MELIDKDKQERTSQMQRKVLQHLTESGNVSYACKRAGVSRETYYTWKKEDKIFAEDAKLAIDYGKSFVNDLAHTQLIANIQKGDMQAVRFQLISCHDDYKPRRALPPQEPAEEKLAPITKIIINAAKPRVLSPSPAPSEPPREKKGQSSASPSAKPVPQPKANDEVEPPHPLRWRGWDDDDFDFEIDRRDLLGPR